MRSFERLKNPEITTESCSFEKFSMQVKLTLKFEGVSKV